MKKWPFFAFGIPALVTIAAVVYLYLPNLIPSLFPSSSSSVPSSSTPPWTSQTPFIPGGDTGQPAEETSATSSPSAYDFIMEHPTFRYTTKEGNTLTFKDSGSHYSYALSFVDGVAPGKDLVIPSTVLGIPVTEIDSDAGAYVGESFTGTKLVIEEGITKIGMSAFQGLPVKEIVLPPGISEITFNVFRDTKVLEKITWGSDVTSICAGAFAEHNMHKIVLPDTIVSLSDTAFHSAAIDDLEIVLNESIKYFSFASSKVAKVVFPSQCSSIPDSCFDRAIGLKEIVMEQPITSIGSLAFRDTNLAELATPLDLSACTSLGNEAFAYCRCPSMTVDISKMENLGRDIFSQAKIGGVELGDRTYDTIGMILRGYQGPVLVGEESPYALYGHDIYTKDFKTLLCASTSFDGLSLHPSCTALGPYLYYVRAEEENIFIPNQIVELGKGCFGGNEGTIKSVNLNNVVTVGDGAFAQCRALETVETSGALRVVGTDGFARCGSLASFPLVGLESIGGSAFASTPLSSIVTGPGLTFLGDGAFSWLTSDSCRADLSASAKLEAIPYYLFSRSQGLYSVTLPSSIKSIGEDWCGGTKVTTFNIPASLERLGPYALQKMSINDFRSTRLQSVGRHCFNETTFSTVYLPATITSLESYAFAGGRITTLSYAGTMEQWRAIDKGERLGGSQSLTVNASDGSFTIF